MAEAGGVGVPYDQRRLRRRCLWALAVVLPAAFVMRGWDSAAEWWRTKDLFPRSIDMTAVSPLAGAEWRVASFQRIAERRNGASVVVLELEATVRDPEMLSRLPCRIAVVDDRGRRWLPGFLPPSEVSRLPAIRARPAASCNSAIASKPEAGAVLVIRESFMVPRGTFETLAVTISLPAERPHYLRFARSPQPPPRV